jgi:hypothetical protein
MRLAFVEEHSGYCILQRPLHGKLLIQYMQHAAQFDAYRITSARVIEQ